MSWLKKLVGCREPIRKWASSSRSTADMVAFAKWLRSSQAGQVEPERIIRPERISEITDQDGHPSMAPTFGKGSVLLFESVKEEDVRVGDIVYGVGYWNRRGSRGEHAIFVHRAKRINPLVTQGDNNAQEDDFDGYHIYGRCIGILYGGRE